jgi:hypothetical protein
MKYLPAAGIAIFTAIFLAAAYLYPPEARAFPVAVAWMTLFLIALDLVFRTDRRAPAATSGQSRAVAWLAVFALMLVLIGILYAVPVYVVASLRFRGNKSWLTCLGTAAGVTAGIWLLFAVVLRLDLYPGYFFEPR